MHESSYAKMASFLETYREELFAAGAPSILEIGSKSYEGQPSYRELMDPSVRYTGLDLEHGKNVDLVPSGAYLWPELADDLFDLCISGQTFEHNPFFWVTACEVARVLKPGGLCCIIAPGAGPVHRYPIDCYRFYPDSWAAMCHLAGLEPLEVYYETDGMADLVSGAEWRDTMLIARKPSVPSAEAQERRRQICAPFQGGFGEFEPVPQREGKCVAHYRRTVRKRPRLELRNRIARRLRLGAAEHYPADGGAGSS